MDRLKEAVKYGGLFTVDGKERVGELTLNDKATELYLQDPDFFRPDKVGEHCILGVLHDRTRVSLHRCNTPRFPAVARFTVSTSSSPKSSPTMF